jgi:hypothetical protein
MTADRVYVYRVPDDALPEHFDELEVLVQVYAEGPPEVALRPSIDGIALRVWGPPLALTSRADGGGT